MLPWLTAGMSEAEATELDLRTFYVAGAVWATFNLLSGLIAGRLAVTTAAPFSYGRVVADMDRSEPQDATLSPHSPGGKSEERASRGVRGGEDQALAAFSA